MKPGNTQTAASGSGRRRFPAEPGGLMLVDLYGSGQGEPFRKLQ